MLTHEEEIKVRLFQSIADNADKLCDSNRYSTHYFTPEDVAVHVNNVYDKLFNKPKED